MAGTSWESPVTHSQSSTAVLLALPSPPAQSTTIAAKKQPTMSVRRDFWAQHYRRSCKTSSGNDGRFPLPVGVEQAAKPHPSHSWRPLGGRNAEDPAADHHGDRQQVRSRRSKISAEERSLTKISAESAIGPAICSLNCTHLFPFTYSTYCQDSPMT